MRCPHCQRKIGGASWNDDPPARPASPPAAPQGSPPRQFCVEGCPDYPRCAHASLPPGVLPASLQGSPLPGGAAILNALRILAQDIVDNFSCNDEESDEPHGGDWESCWRCFAFKALRHPEDFRDASIPQEGRTAEGAIVEALAPMEEALREGARQERADVVAWFRRCAEGCRKSAASVSEVTRFAQQWLFHARACDTNGDAIERGDHLQPPASIPQSDPAKEGTGG